jgi:putative membrane protein insertion efficiency factor
VNPTGVADRREAESPSAAAWTLLLLVRVYITFLAPFFGGACRFHPSCSNYAAESIALHGARRGASLALRRLLRCNPFNKGGFDPVPEQIAPTAALTRSPGGSQ